MVDAMSSLRGGCFLLGHLVLVVEKSHSEGSYGGTGHSHQKYVGDEHQHALQTNLSSPTHPTLAKVPQAVQLP